MYALEGAGWLGQRLEFMKSLAENAFIRLLQLQLLDLLPSIRSREFNPAKSTESAMPEQDAKGSRFLDSS